MAEGAFIFRPHCGTIVAMTRDRNATGKPPFDADALERAALFYAGRYATTRAKLAAYLRRKLRERGWDGLDAPDVDGLVQRMAGFGYVDDRAFAAAKATALGRRGMGPRRVELALRVAGIEEADAGEARSLAAEGAWSAALRLAERRRIGPFADTQGDFEHRQKALAAMLRAGHAVDIARRIVAAPPGEIPSPDSG